MIERPGVGFELQPAAVHGKARPWQHATAELPAPADYLYLADHAAIPFAVVAAKRLGGDPLVVVAEASARFLEPDPSYRKIRRHDPVLAHSWQASIYECGRVASSCGCAVSAAYVCSRRGDLDAHLRETGMWEMLRSWPAAERFQPIAEKLGVDARTLSDFRRTIGADTIERFFERY